MTFVNWSSRKEKRRASNADRCLDFCSTEQSLKGIKGQITITVTFNSCKVWVFVEVEEIMPCFPLEKHGYSEKNPSDK